MLVRNEISDPAALKVEKAKYGSDIKEKNFCIQMAEH